MWQRKRTVRQHVLLSGCPAGCPLLDVLLEQAGVDANSLRVLGHVLAASVVDLVHVVVDTPDLHGFTEGRRNHARVFDRREVTEPNVGLGSGNLHVGRAELHAAGERGQRGGVPVYLIAVDHVHACQCRRGAVCVIGPESSIIN